MIDRVTTALGRPLYEVPVGFKWFVDGLLSGAHGFVGEESAGATFLRRDGSVWTTDKDGIVAAPLAAEMMATTGRDPGEIYTAVTRDHGDPVYERLDAPAEPAGAGGPCSSLAGRPADGSARRRIDHAGHDAGPRQQ